MRRGISGLLAGAVITLVILAAAGLLIIYTGSFNVAATEEHSSLVRWAFHTTMHESVKMRSANISEPKSFSPEMVAAGGPEYAAMCQHCHAGPGVKRSAWASGMRPQPPHLTEEGEHWELRDVFWLVKHGVKMSGMPAFGPSHDDRTLWNIAAFVKELPAMTPEDYASLTRGAHGDAETGQHNHEGATKDHETSQPEPTHRDSNNSERSQ